MKRRQAQDTVQDPWRPMALSPDERIEIIAVLDAAAQAHQRARSDRTAQGPAVIEDEIERICGVHVLLPEGVIRAAWRDWPTKRPAAVAEVLGIVDLGLRTPPREWVCAKYGYL